MDGDGTLNPLATIGAAVLGSGAAAVEEAADGNPALADSDAVLLTVPREQRLIGRLLSNADGRPSLLYRFAQAVAIFNAVYGVLYGPHVDASWAGMSEPNHLQRVSKTILSLTFVWALLPLESARVALQPGGFLDMLGADTTKISASAAGSVARSRVILLVVATLVFLFGLMATAASAAGRNAPPMSSAASVGMVQLYAGATAVAAMTFAIALFVGWWSSMKLGSALVRDVSVEVIKNVQKTSPEDTKAWSKEVEAPALELNTHFKQLSAGWGMGLLGATLCLWSFSLARLTDALNTPRNTGLALHIGRDDMGSTGSGRGPDSFFITALVSMTLVAPLPLFLAHDIASTSSCADWLMDTLNDARIQHGKGHDTTITWLERALRNLNHGQGLGQCERLALFFWCVRCSAHSAHPCVLSEGRLHRRWCGAGPEVTSENGNHPRRWSHNARHHAVDAGRHREWRQIRR